MSDAVPHGGASTAAATASPPMAGAVRRPSGLRVLHVAEAFGGGLLEIVRLIAEGSTTAGHSAAIAFGRRPETPTDLGRIVSPAVELFDLGWDRGSMRSHARAVVHLHRIVRRWRPDVVHLHSSYAGAVGIAGGLRAPVMYTPHAWASAIAPPRLRGAYETVERLMVARADMIGAVSISEAAIARRFDASSRIVVVPNGIRELDRPQSAGGSPARARQRPLVVAMGRLVGQRRPAEAAGILGALSDVADVEWIGGGGDQGPAGQAARCALEAAGVRVTGWLPRPAALQRLAAATAYLHWTAWDGLPLSVVEAIAQGTVVVASDTEPNRELLDAVQLASRPDDAVAMLRRVVADAGFRAERIAAQASRTGEYSAARMVERWLELYAELARDGARAPSAPASSSR